MGTGRIIQTDNIDGLRTTKNFLSNGLATLNTSGWVTFNSVRSSLAADSVDAINTTGGHGLPLGVYVQVKVLTVATPCGLTAGNIYYALPYTTNLASFHTAPGVPQVNITADSAITWTETRPAVPYGTANITWGVTTTNPLSDAKSFLLTKDAANRQYQGVMTDFTIDNAYKAKVLNAYMDYIVDSGTFVAGSNTTDSDVIIYLYDVTNNQIIEPSSYKLLSNSTTIADRYSSSFQTPYNSTSYRLVILVASASTAAYALKMDNIGVSPSNYVYGTPITDWQSYTPTIGGLGSGSTSANSARYRRVGDSVQIELSFTKDATAGAGVSTVTVSLPNVNVDVSKVSSGGDGFVGVGFSSDTTVSASNLVSSYNESLKSIVFTYGNTVVTGSAVTANSVWRALITLPILGWSSSVQVSDGYDGRVVAANVYRNAATANQSIPNATYTGVGFDSKNFDTTNDFTLSPSSNGSYFTVKSAGYYRVSASITFTGNGTNARILAIAKNTPSGVIEHLATSAGTAAAVTLSGTRTIYANADDKIYISAYQDSGAALNLSQFWNEASIEKLSGSPTISASETVALMAGNSSGQLITNTAPAITGWTTYFSTHGNFNTSTGIYTFNSPGIYFVHADLTILSSQGDFLQMYANQSGAGSTAGTHKIARTMAYGTEQLAGGMLLDVKAGDTFFLSAYCNFNRNLEAVPTVNKLNIFKAK